jgi:primosomal protein N' (replication factor Y)
VLPDEAAIDRVFDYVVPPELPGADRLTVGTEVRIALHGRRVGGWVVALDTVPPAGIELSAVSRIRGAGPPGDVVELCRWVAWRWAGRWANVLRFASPGGAVVGLPARRSWHLGSPSAAGAAAEPAGIALEAAGTAAGSGRPAVVRWPPATPLMPLVRAVAASLSGGSGSAIVVMPDAERVDAAARRLRQEGVAVAVLPRDWAMAASGGVVAIGARGAVFAPVPDPAVIVVVDEHDEALQDERVPTWHARDVAVERARRAGVACLLVSPLPTPEAVAAAGGPDAVVVAPRLVERSGWSALVVVDRSGEEPRRRPLVAPAVVGLLRHPGRVLCVLNRTGHVRLARCATCRTPARCERCGAAVSIPSGSAELQCASCGVTRPPVCLGCGGGRFAAVRTGTAKAREELAVLAGEPVGEVTARTTELPDERLLIGTEAVLRRVDRADAVVFLDIDGELLAPRMRAPQQALAMLARACRIVGGRAGRVVAQTNAPGHEVLDAVRLADPGRFLAVELARRERLALPPWGALAQLSGPGAAALAGLLAPTLESIGGAFAAAGPAGGDVVVRAPSSAALADALDAALSRPDRPRERVRVEVDPPRI